MKSNFASYLVNLKKMVKGNNFLRQFKNEKNVNFGVY